MSEMMKALVLLAVVMLVSLCGCSKNKRLETDNYAISIYVDQETGVNYYVYCSGYAGGMTVRVNSDGTPYTSEVRK